MNKSINRTAVSACQSINITDNCIRIAMASFTPWVETFPVNIVNVYFQRSIPIVLFKDIMVAHNAINSHVIIRSIW